MTGSNSTALSAPHEKQLWELYTGLPTELRLQIINAIFMAPVGAKSSTAPHSTSCAPCTQQTYSQKPT